jgi:SNF5 / SMARCB1 / INI1
LFYFSYLSNNGASDVLVPITIEIDLEDFKILDSFTWNLNEKNITPEKFAEYFCGDLGLDQNHYASTVSRSIRQQVDAFKKYYQYSDAPLSEDTRTIIRLDIVVGKVQLRDRFEWDLASELKPEIFAAQLVDDLHLGGEFVTLISHRYAAFF